MVICSQVLIWFCFPSVGENDVLSFLKVESEMIHSAPFGDFAEVALHFFFQLDDCVTNVPNTRIVRKCGYLPTATDLYVINYGKKTKWAKDASLRNT